MFGWLYGYSILFQFISTKTISTFHHRYERVTLQVTTSRPEEIMKAYVSHFRHGISCVDAIGGYSHQRMALLHTVVSSYEVADIVMLMRSQDPHVIINAVKTENLRRLLSRRLIRLYEDKDGKKVCIRLILISLRQFIL